MFAEAEPTESNTVVVSFLAAVGEQRKSVVRSHTSIEENLGVAFAIGVAFFGDIGLWWQITT